MPAKRKRQQKQFGKQPPRFRFFLNPYTDARFTTCPICRAKMRQRKLPLVIHVDPLNPIALNKTCRYCPACDLLIAHKDEIEAFLVAFFSQHNPDVIGNDYLVIGTMDRPDWLEGMKTPRSFEEALEFMHDFKEVLQFELAPTWQAG